MAVNPNTVRETFTEEQKRRIDEALLAAAKVGDLAGVLQALQANADVNAEDTTGATALYLAILCGHIEMAKILIAAGANVDKTPKNGITALYWAAWDGNTEITNALIAAGANVNVNAFTKAGITPLYYAVCSGSLETVKALLTAGADVDARMNNDKIPLSIAKTEIRELLTIYATAQALWSIWELESPLYLSYLQWLPQEMLEDVVAAVDRKSLRQQSQLSLGNSKSAFFPNSVVQGEGNAANQSKVHVEQTIMPSKCVFQP